MTTRNKFKRKDHNRKFLHFFEFTNIPRVMWNTRRGCHINFFLKISIQKGIFNMKLRYMPLTNRNYYNKSTNSNHFCNMSKYLLTINVILLRVSFCNQYNFVLLNRSIKISLDLIYPTTILGFIPYPVDWGGV